MKKIQFFWPKLSVTIIEVIIIFLVNIIDSPWIQFSLFMIGISILSISDFIKKTEKKAESKDNSEIIENDGVEYYCLCGDSGIKGELCDCGTRFEYTDEQLDDLVKKRMKEMEISDD